MKCGIHVYVCHDALSMQCLYALLDLSWCGTAQNTERRTLVSHTVYTCKLLSFDLFLRPSVLTADGTFSYAESIGKTASSFPDRFSVGNCTVCSQDGGTKEEVQLVGLVNCLVCW